MLKSAHPHFSYLPEISAQTFTYIAHAKLNLFLHVTNRLPSGLHELDSMIGFTEYGDRVRLDPADEFRLSYSGLFADLLDRQTTIDLVEKAARAYADKKGIRPNISIHLEKNLPIASGIGGGSADAAAVLKGLSKIWGPLPATELDALALSLGADVPMCLSGKAAIATGVGEKLAPITQFPPAYILLVNPGIHVSTPAIFKARTGNFSKKSFTEKNTFVFQHLPDLVHFLSTTHNDLAPPAIQLAPVIQTTLSALQACDACLLARMSGSGATCFAFFATETDCHQAEIKIRQQYPEWWLQSTHLISSAVPPVSS